MRRVRVDLQRATVELDLHEVGVGGARGAFSSRGRVVRGHLEGPDRPGNLAHRRPHVPTHLAATREAVLGALGASLRSSTWMHQVHGARVATVDAASDDVVEVRGVDALVGTTPGRALVVQVADCVPVLLADASGRAAGAVHAGRAGVAAGVVDAAVTRLAELADGPLHAVVGPAIGGCCYEVPAAMRDDVARDHPAAHATTTWGTPALDLPAAVRERLTAHAVAVDAPFGCTHCEDGWFSHRRDPAAGRQVGVVLVAQ